MVSSFAELISTSPYDLAADNATKPLRVEVSVQRYSTNVAMGVGAFTAVYDPNWTGATNALGGATDALGGGTWVNVTRPLTPAMFGARGDGTTDDTLAVQAMINWAGTNEMSLGAMIFGINQASQATNAPDSYHLSALTLSGNGFTLRGPGTLKSLATNEGIVMLTVDGDENLIEDVTFDGAFTATGTSDTHGIAIRNHGSDNRFTGLRIKDQGYIGMQILSSLPVSGNNFPTNNTVTTRRTIVSDSWFSGIHSSGILTKPGGASELHLDNLLFTDVAINAVKLDGEPLATNDVPSVAMLTGITVNGIDPGLGESSPTGGQGAIAIQEGYANVIISGLIVTNGVNSTQDGSVAGVRGIQIEGGQTPSSVSTVTVTGFHIGGIDGEGVLIRTTDDERLDHITITDGRFDNIGQTAIVTSTSGANTGLIGGLNIRDVTIHTAPVGVTLTSQVSSGNLDNVQVTNPGGSGFVFSGAAGLNIGRLVVTGAGQTNTSARGVQITGVTGLRAESLTVSGVSNLYGVEITGSTNITVGEIKAETAQSHGTLVAGSSTNIWLGSVFGRNNGQGGAGGYALNLSSVDGVHVGSVLGVDDQATNTQDIVLNIAGDTDWAAVETVAQNPAGVAQLININGTKTSVRVGAVNPTRTVTFGSTTTLTAVLGQMIYNDAVTATGDFTLTWNQFQDGANGVLRIYPPSTNIVVTLAAMAGITPAGTTYTVEGGTGKWAELAWRNSDVGGTNLISANLANYGR